MTISGQVFDHVSEIRNKAAVKYSTVIDGKMIKTLIRGLFIFYSGSF